MLSQVDRLKNLLLDGRPHRTDEILKIVYGSEHRGIARVGARIYDLKGKGYDIKSWRDDKNPTLWWYQMAMKTVTYSVLSPEGKVEKTLSYKI